jgi:hypothetical protein
MKSVGFKFNLNEKVIAGKNDFSGIVTMCAIRGDAENPEQIYYVQGATASDWYSEKLLKEAE